MIFCFDFDLTLTDVHSGGFPKTTSDYFDRQSLVEIRATFMLLRASNHKIYIVTRGVESLVKRYVSQPRVDLSDFISETYGADRNFPVEREGDDGWGLAWAHKKAEFLNVIAEREMIKKDDIYFFDDTKVNIDIAVENGFSNSYNNGHLEHGSGLMPVVREILDR